MSSKTLQQQLNVIEFFSGIGGMHYALKSFMKVTLNAFMFFKKI